VQAPSPYFMTAIMEGRYLLKTSPEPPPTAGVPALGEGVTAAVGGGERMTGEGALNRGGRGALRLTGLVANVICMVLCPQKVDTKDLAHGPGYVCCVPNTCHVSLCCQLYIVHPKE
jgi:hypothetical protein